ncbi:hypothetical protein Cgig2_034077 [Carnegiea gigantea]|uniref:Uncharacterized protein n=1 Tax=Carnegiea gigantea TaxID=171969 RepID=A0A9Q1GJZ9_9CARY|nr:hypothetical protein Cgig2_005526 [Carnegiea gigantea]KAJ8421990.1 hypothetical protein Cgig2_034077 [Carnegiea gigantea]
MANTRGGKAPKRPSPASKAKESASFSPPKRRCHRIAAGTSKRACKSATKTTVTILDSPSVSDRSSDNSASTQSAIAPSSLIKITANSVFFESIVKSVKITLSCPILESIFGLKFVDTTPPNLSRKVAKDLCLKQFASPQKLEAYTWENKAPPIMFYSRNLDCWQHLSDLTPDEVSSLKIKLPDTGSAPHIADTLTELKEDHAELRTQLEHIQVEMGLMNRKINE